MVISIMAAKEEVIRSDNNPAHIGSILFNRGKEVIGTLDCFPEKIALVVVGLDLEGRGPCG